MKHRVWYCTGLGTLNRDEKIVTVWNGNGVLDPVAYVPVPATFGKIADYIERDARARLLAKAPALMASLKELLEFGQQSIKDIGGCDHKAGICICKEIEDCTRAADLIAEIEGELK